MTELAIKITETVAIDYVAKDGQHWSSEADAQRYNAELAMCQILGKGLLDSPQVHVFTYVSALAFKVPAADILILRNVMDAYLKDVLPQMMALIGPFSYGTGRQIETPDGRKFDHKHKAALHMLETFFGLLWDTNELSDRGRRAICNVSLTFNDLEMLKKQGFNRYHFTSNLMKFFKLTDDAGNPRPGYEQKFRDALQAIIVERSRPIKGKKRPGPRAKKK